jgi:hypothetical protein
MMQLYWQVAIKVLRGNQEDLPNIWRVSFAQEALVLRWEIDTKY